MPIIQAVCFTRDIFSTAAARRWLRKHEFKPIKKVHQTKTLLRYRMHNPDPSKQHRVKKIADGINLIIEF